MLGDFLQNISLANSSYSTINHHNPASNNMTTWLPYCKLCNC